MFHFACPPKMRLLLFLFLLSLALSSSPQLTNSQPLIKLVWMNYSQPNNPFSLLTLPTTGLAIYSAHNTNFPDGQPVRKTYFNLYQGHSELKESNIIVCQQTSLTSYCQNANEDFMDPLSPITPKNTIGELIVDTEQLRILALKYGEEIQIVQKSQLKENIEFALTTLGSLIFTLALFQLTVLKVLDQHFFLQFMFSLCLFVRQSCSFVRQAIENWVDQHWKFWLFLPLALLSYKILEKITEQFIDKRLKIKTATISLTVNLILLVLSGSRILYPIVSFSLIFWCSTDHQSIGQTLPKRDKDQVIVSIARVRTIFIILNIFLLFQKQWSYVVFTNPNYFIVGLASILSISLAESYQRSLLRTKEQIEQSKQRIKIITNKSQLFKQLPALSTSETLNYECPICYEKIESNWAKTPCCHLFHDHCLYKWLEKSQSCPIDRAKILSDQPKPSKLQSSVALQQA